MDWLSPQVQITGTDILTDISGHLRPLITLRHKFQCLPMFCMPSYLGIMMKRYNVLAEVINVQNINFALK